MSRKLTKDEFIKRSRATHGDKYTYDQVFYVSNSTKVKIYCKVHKECFSQAPSNHFAGKEGCKHCSKGSKSLTTEKVVARFKNINGNFYDYSKVEYVNIRTKVEVVCPAHGSFYIRPQCHYKGVGCKKCFIDRLTLSEEEYLDSVKKKHNNKYDYSLVDYVDTSEKIKIVCPSCGPFEIVANKHRMGSGCPKCGHKERGKRSRGSKATFVNSAREVHGSLYNYDKVVFKLSKEKVLMHCTVHNKDFWQTPSNHIKGQKAPCCGLEDMSNTKTMTKEEFVTKSRTLHGDKYDYTNTKYVGVSYKVDILCRKCGEVFSQLAQSHLQKSGCPTCGRERMGWSKKVWKKSGKTFTFYVLRCFNENEVFIKVGRTRRSIKKRYGSKKDMPYNYEILRIIKSKNADYIFDLENRVKRFFKERGYIPRTSFGGETECFTHINVKSNKNRTLPKQ